MKTRTFLMALFGMLSLWHGMRGEVGPWVSLPEVQSITLAAVLAEYPISQAQLPAVLGFRDFFRINGHLKMETGDSVFISALTDPDSITGFYALKLISRGHEAPPSETIEILSAQVVFCAPWGQGYKVFVVDPEDRMFGLVPMLREKMKKEGLTPAAAAREFFGSPEGAAIATPVIPRP